MSKRTFSEIPPLENLIENAVARMKIEKPAKLELTSEKPNDLLQEHEEKEEIQRNSSGVNEQDDLCEKQGSEIILEESENSACVQHPKNENSDVKIRIRYTIQQKEKVGSLLECYSVDKVHSMLHEKISSSTLYKWQEKIFKGESLEQAKGQGKKPMYSQIEHELFEWFLFERAKKIPISTKLLQAKSLEIAKELNITAFNGSIGWIQKFEKRYNLVSRCVTHYSNKTIGYAKTEIKSFYDKLNNVIKNYTHDEIWNFDEVPIYFEPTIKKTIDIKGAETVTVISGNAMKKRMTLIIAISASGILCPPILLYFEKDFKTFEIDYPGALIISNHSGYNTQETMMNKVLPHFLAYIQKHSIMIFDKCTAHCGKQIIEFMQKHELTSIMIPAGTTCLLQPVDTSLIGKNVKNAIKNMFIEWNIKIMSENEIKINESKDANTNIDKKAKTVKTVPNNEIIGKWIAEGIKLLTKENIQMAFSITGITSNDSQKTILEEKVSKYFNIINDEDFDFLHFENEHENEEDSKSLPNQPEKCSEKSEKKIKLIRKSVGKIKNKKDEKRDDKNSINVDYSINEWKKCECVGDGNCLFRSVSEIIFNSQDMHEKVRQDVVNHLIKNRMKYEEFILTAKISFEEYISKMNTLKTWGDHIEIQAITEIYSRPVQILSEVKEKGYIISKTLHEENVGKEEPIRLIYSNGNHYDALKKN